MNGFGDMTEQEVANLLGIGVGGNRAQGRKDSKEGEVDYRKYTSVNWANGDFECDQTKKLYRNCNQRYIQIVLDILEFKVN